VEVRDGISPHTAWSGAVPAFSDLEWIIVPVHGREAASSVVCRDQRYAIDTAILVAATRRVANRRSKSQ